MKDILNSDKRIVVTYDRNGKAIHNGCGILFHNEKGIVKYNTSSCRFEIEWEDGTRRSITSDFAKKVEVDD